MADDSEKLARQNRSLTEQVKVFVRTEQRLHRVQRNLEGQLRRIEELNDFALEASGARTDTDLLDRALALLLRLFPFDQAVAFLPDEQGVLRAARATSVPGLLGDAPTRVASRPPTGATTAAVPDAPVTSATPALEPVLACMEELFAGFRGRQPAHAVLAVPLRSGNGPEALLVARKLDPHVHYFEALPSPDDLPFVRLLATHVQSALEATRQRARLSSVLAHLPSAIFVLRGGRVVQSNEAARRMLGCTEEQSPTGDLFLDLVPPEERVAYATLEQSVARDGSLRLLERRLLDRHGKARPVELTALPLAFEGRPATLVIAEDTAERMQMRTALAFADRLASVGALAAGVAHEINNPLTYVLFHLDRLVKAVPEQYRPSALSALDGASRIRAIVRDLQTFVRPDAGTVEPVDVESVMERVLGLAAPELRYGARIVRDYRKVERARGSEARLSQVFLNLVINAVRAMSEGAAHQNELRVATRMDGERVAIDVEDTGVGIAPSDLARVFDPFFTTSHTAGSGLGLSICRNLVEALGGTIEVVSALGRGSRFTVLLPVDRSATEHAVSSPPHLSPRRGSVLVIDDDPRLVTVLVALLGDTHEVTTAQGGAAAIAALATDAFDAIVCDLMMPDVSGMDVFVWIEQHRPDLASRIVFLTGGTVTRRSQDFVATIELPVLTKPMGITELLAAIERVRSRA